MSKLPFAAIVAASFTATSAFAQAQDPFLLGTIFIGSGSTSVGALGAADANASNEVGLTLEELDRTAPVDVQDIFKSEPTVSVGSSLPISQKVYVQGVEETNLNFTIDGARQNNRIFHHAASNYIDPELLKAVRVDPGVAPADAGPGALGGAIAFETKDAGDLLLPGQSFGGRASVGYASNGDTRTGSLALYGIMGSVDFLVFGKIADGGLRKDGDGNTIVGSETALTSGLGKLGVTTGKGGRIELSYENVVDDAERPVRADFAGLVRGGVLNDGTRTYALDRENIVLTYEVGQVGALWNPTLQLAYGSTELFTGPLAGATDAFRGTTTSLNGKIQNEFALGSGTITAGLDFYRDTTEINGERTATLFAKEEASNVGLFAQGRFDLSDRFRVSAGLRFDVQQFEGVDGTRYDNNGFSGNVAADYDVTDAITISAGASRVWGGIQLAESFVFDPAWVYPASIDPVTSENVYLGANASFGAWDLKAKVFQTNINNARTLFDAASERYGLNPGDTNDLEARGFELGVGYNWANGFVRVAYAKVDTKAAGFDADGYSGRYLTTPLGDSVVVQAGHRFDQIGLTIGGDAQFTSDNDVFYRGTFSGTQEGFKVVNAFAEYKPQQLPGLTVRGEVSNIFDEQYSERGTYGQEFGSVVPLAEPGRTFAIKATYQF